MTVRDTSVGAAPPESAATRTLTAALAANPGSTVQELASAAKISHSTAFNALVALEKAGLASRHLGGLHGAKVMADRWQAGPLTVKELHRRLRGRGGQAQRQRGGQAPSRASGSLRQQVQDT